MIDSSTPSSRSEIAGSHRYLDPAWERVAPADPASTATVTVYVRDPVGPPSSGVAAGVAGGVAVPALSRSDYQAAHAARAEDIQAVLDFAAGHGLAVGEISRERRSIQLTGPVEAITAAFGASDVALYRHPVAGVFRGRSGPLSVPAHLGVVVTGVFGLDNRMAARTQFRPAAAPAVQYTPPQIAAAYDFPTSVTGAGQCVAIVELGGGYRTADLTAYFKQIGLPAPSVGAVSVDGGANAPTTADSADGEVMLDIEVVGGLAPDAKIVVYFAPNTDQGFIDAITQAAHDTVNAPSVISISWGGPEGSWTQQAMQQMEAAFADATAMGVTVAAAAGDNGSTDGETDGQQHVDFPASAPHALACGGTSLPGTTGTGSGETVWNDGASGGATGGGISDVFAIPTYQAGTTLPPSANDGQTRRGVPDVSGDAEPNTGWTVRVDGETIPIGGTSAVAPMWAGLIALLNQALGTPVGFVHPMLYSADAAATFVDITSGSNGAYDAGTGWDACTGLGSPDGSALLAALQAAVTAPPGSSGGAPPADASSDAYGGVSSAPADG